MSDFKDGGPAFPIEFSHVGMSLRDYYAGKALEGICAHQDTWGLQPERICEAAFELADAMLKARKA